MIKPRPGDRGRERGGSGFSIRPFRNTAPVAPFQDPQPFHRLDDITHTEIRAYGVDPDWPVPQTQRLEVEAGGPGGWR